MPETPSPSLAERAEKRQGRGTDWVFIEMLCAFLAVADVHIKLVDGRDKRERLVYQNNVFEHQVQSKWDDQQWVDQYDITEDKKTPPQCIQERFDDIKTDTQETCISIMFDTITRSDRNVCLPHLHTFLDSNGHIRSGQVKEDDIEALRLHYFEYKK